MLSMFGFIKKELEAQGKLPEKFRDKPPYKNKMYLWNELSTDTSSSDPNGIQYSFLGPFSNTAPLFDLSKRLEFTSYILGIRDAQMYVVFEDGSDILLHVDTKNSEMKSGYAGLPSKLTKVNTSGKEVGMKVVFDPQTQKWSSYYQVNGGAWTNHFTYQTSNRKPIRMAIAPFTSTVYLSRTTIVYDGVDYYNLS